MASTPKQEVNARAGDDDDVSLSGASAEQLVGAAEEILEDYLQPGRWPTARRVERFRQGGLLERVLALYARAMEMAPQEPAYRWNLASALDRLRLHDLALIYMARAIRVAEAVGHEEWAGAHAHLGWADIAIKASEPDLAAIAIEKARRLDPDVPVERYERLLRAAVRPPERPDPERNEDSARTGAAVEHLIAASCMLASDFELNVSTNLVDDEGVDLVFHRRGGTATLGVQVKSRSQNVVGKRPGHRFLAQIRDATFKRAQTCTCSSSRWTRASGTTAPCGSSPARTLVQTSDRTAVESDASSRPPVRLHATAGAFTSSSAPSWRRAFSRFSTAWRSPGRPVPSGPRKTWQHALSAAIWAR